MNILELYEKIKNIKGVDIALLDSYLKVILKDADCESVEELFQKISEYNYSLEQKKNESEELSSKLDCIMNLKSQLITEKIEIRDLATAKSMLLLLGVFIIMAIAAASIAINFTLLTCVIAAASVVISGFTYTKINNKIMQTYYDILDKCDKTDEEEKTYSLDHNKVVEDLLSLNEQGRILNKVNDEACTFINTYLDSILESKEDAEKLEVDSEKEEVDTRIYDMHLQL